MNYGAIKSHDVANGPGVRVSLFVSGCKNHCPGCFNEETWDFNYGQRFTGADLENLIELLSHDYIQGLTILGGDPMELENQQMVACICMLVKSELRTQHKDIWLYTGYVLDRDLVPGGKRYHEDWTPTILRNIDVIVDGPFVESLKDISLRFRGSSNQRIIENPIKALTKIT